MEDAQCQKGVYTPSQGGTQGCCSGPGRCHKHWFCGRTFKPGIEKNEGAYTG